MADGIKISQLPQLVEATVDDNDELAIVDVSDRTTKKITRSALVVSPLTNVDINGGTIDGTTIGSTSASTGAFTTLTASTSLNVGSSTTVNGVIDDDTMATASATKLSTSESIKAYVDSQVGTVDTLAEILTNGNTTGGTNLVVSSGDVITTNTINETTAASGVTVDGVLLKDSAVTADLTGNVTSTGTSTFSTVDINGGTIDGATIGGSSAAAITGTTLTATTSATLQHSSSTKLATTSTGIDVTGTVTADGLTVDGTIPAVAVLNSTSNGVRIEFNGASTPASRPWEVGVLNTANGDFNIYQAADVGAGDIKLYTDGVLRQNIDAQTGDISFYDSTGTSQNLFWDASASRLGLGTTSPDKLMHLKTAVNNTAVLRIESTATDSYPYLSLKNDAREYQLTAHGPLGDVFTIYDGTAGSHRFVIDSSGRVGIGTASPAATLDVNGTIKLDGNYPVGTQNVGLGDNALSVVEAGASNNVGVGASALTALTTGDDNTAVGNFALAATTGNQNTGVGQQALRFNTSGNYNTAQGYRALFSNTTASNNTAVGYQAGYANTTGDQIVALGAYSLYNNTTGGSNTAVGLQSMFTNTTGGENTAVGLYSLFDNTTGTRNTAIGLESLANNTTASNNVAVGYQAGFSNTTGQSNILMGRYAGYANNAGSQNVAIGDSSAYTTTGNYNIAIGGYALLANSTSSGSVAVGYEALRANTASYNTAVGYGTLYANTSGAINTAVGTNALRNNTTGSQLVAMGHDALVYNTTGSYNTAIGKETLFSNTTASYNTAVGYQALNSNTTATQNTMVGYYAGGTASGSYNTGVGSQALRYNTGAENTAFGSVTLFNNTSGNYNTAIGRQALFSNTTASNNTAVGYRAGYSNTGNNGNTFIGKDSGYYTTGGFNTFVGATNSSGNGSGELVTTGSRNTILGGYNGNQGGLDIRTSSNQIVLSDGDGNPRVYVDSNGSMAVGTTGFDASNTTGVTQQLYSNGAYITIGGTSGKGNGEGFINFNRNGSTIGSVTQASTSSVSYNTTSDYRLKENVVDLENATQRLIQLQPKRFEWITDADGAVWDGFLAHEVQAVVPEAITGTKDEVDADGNPVYQGIDQSKLVPLLTAALQEALTKIETLEARITALENA